MCGITCNVNWPEPRDPNNDDDNDASETNLQFNLGWFLHPIAVDGNYPSIMREKIDAKSEAQGKYKKFSFTWIRRIIFFTNEGDPNIAIVLFIGFPESRLPSFTKEDSEEIVGSFDFIGINFYTADIVFTKESDPNVVSYYADQDVSSYKVDIYNW